MTNRLLPISTSLDILPIFTFQLPYVVFQDTSFVPTIKATPVSRNSLTSTQQPTLVTPELSRKLRKNLSRTAPVTRKERKVNMSAAELQRSIKQNLTRHCVCECPELDEVDVEEWTQHYASRLERNKTKPFRTGKDASNLISKRHFESRKSLSPEKKLYKGLLLWCLSKV